MSIRRIASVALLIALVACGEPIIHPADVWDADETLVATSAASTTTLVVPFAESTVTPEDTSTAVDDRTSLSSVPSRTSQTTTLQVAPKWFDFETVVSVLKASEEAFGLAKVSSYRFRSTLTFLGNDEQIWGEEGATMELIGEVTKEPPAIHRVLTGPLLEDDSPSFRDEWITIEDRIWRTEGYGIWEEVDEPFSLSPVFPIDSYRVAADAAARALKRADALRDGTISMLGQEKINGLDVLHLRATWIDTTTDHQVDIWITPESLLVSLRGRVDYPNSADANESTWDMYDLGVEIDIQPPMP